jgi:proteasome lid subunit RPN8/RPN11
MLIRLDICSAIINHAQRSAPRECCGIIAGDQFFAIDNVADVQQNEYVMNAEQQLAVYRIMDKEGLALNAVYHSHPKHPPTPSGADVALMIPDLCYIIAGRIQTGGWGLGAWRREGRASLRRVDLVTY